MRCLPMLCFFFRRVVQSVACPPGWQVLDWWARRCTSLRHPTWLGAIFILWFSCPIMANSLDDNTQRFNIKQANKTFDHINLKLSTQNLNPNDLNTAIETLGNYTKQAEQCMSDEKKRLTSINALIPKNASSADKNTVGADLLYLSSEKKKIASRLAQCRLFSIRAREAIEAYKTTMAQMTQEETLTRSLPLWEVINELIKSPSQNIFNAVLQIPVPSPLKSPLIWSILVCSALILSSILLLWIRKTHFAKHFLHIKKLHAGHAFLWSMCLLAGTIFIYLFILLPDSVFQLCCLIKDVNKKLLVQSDLNFAIDELLRENNI